MVTLDAAFDTSVPVPIVLVQPNVIDFAMLESGTVPYVDLVFTNYGLVEALDVSVYIGHPVLTFTFAAGSNPLPTLPPNTSVIVRMTVNSPSSGGSRRRLLDTTSENGPCIVIGHYHAPCPTAPVQTMPLYGFDATADCHMAVGSAPPSPGTN